VAVKNTIIVIAKYHMIEHSSAALLTHAVKPGAIDRSPWETENLM